MANNLFNNKLYLPVLSLIVVLLIAYTAYDQYSQRDESWSCSQFSCDKMMSAEEWITTNCFDAKTDAGEEKVCGVIINSNKQLVPLRNINLSQVRQCAQIRCIQEINTRKADYIIQQ